MAVGQLRKAACDGLHIGERLNGFKKVRP